MIKWLFYICIWIYCLSGVSVVALPEKSIGQKAEQLHYLQSIADKINLFSSLGDYYVTVPPFIVLTTEDIQAFLSGVPSDQTVKIRSRSRKIYSMFDRIKQLWQQINYLQSTETILVPRSKKLLQQIRENIHSSFKHNILDVLAESKKNFIQDLAKKKAPLIVRTSTDEPLIAIKSVYPVTIEKLNQAIGQVLMSYFNEETVQQRLEQGTLGTQLYLAIILQTLIIEDPDDPKTMIVSGISCSHDPISKTPHVNTIESAYGFATGVKEQSIATDRFYVHHDMTYPVIAKKLNRVIPDVDLMDARLVPNPVNIQTQATLDLDASRIIAKITKLIREHYQQPVCLSFVKRDVTIYLLRATPLEPIKRKAKPTYINPRYLKKIPVNQKVPIELVFPFNEVIVIKKPHQIILASNAQEFMQEMHKQKEPDSILVGILEQKPSIWSKEGRLLAALNKPIIWSSNIPTIRSWLEKKKCPHFVIDTQQKYIFPFKRRKGFCMLFYTIQKGIIKHPITPQLSVMPSFIPSINAIQRAKLKPNEFFSGVTLEQLFDIIKTKPLEIAQQALQTILYRAQMDIKRLEITKEEHLAQGKTFDESQLKNMKTFYANIETFVYHAYAQLIRWNDSAKLLQDDMEKFFVINMLQALMLQDPDEQIIDTISFKQVR